MVKMPVARLFITALVISIGIGVNIAHAQQQPCAEFMKFGIYDEYDTLSSKKYFELLQKWFCSHQFSSYAEAEKEAAKVGFGMALLHES